MKKSLLLLSCSAFLLTGCISQSGIISITDQNRTPIEGAEVSLENGRTYTFSTDETGKGEYEALRGKYTVKLQKENCEAKYPEQKIEISKENKDFVLEMKCQ